MKWGGIGETSRDPKQISEILAARTDLRRRVEVAGRTGQEGTAPAPWIAAALDPRGGDKVGRLPEGLARGMRKNTTPGTAVWDSSRYRAAAQKYSDA